MNGVSSVLSIYASDVSGVCSALYEMGGMTVMHDASGCNSTYTTHDEPRWYSHPSMVFISALTEMEAIMGDDEAQVDKIVLAARELHPRFIALVGTPVPMMMGTDYRGLARVIESRTGIPTFGFATHGMASYVTGAAMAFTGLAERFCPQPDSLPPRSRDGRVTLNILGALPLDFSVTGNLDALKELLAERGFDLVGCWAMGSPWENLMAAGRAQVNLVVAGCGLPLARLFQNRYGTPWVAGLPLGRKFADFLFGELREAARSGRSDIPAPLVSASDRTTAPTWVIGDAVWSASIRAALTMDEGHKSVRVLCPLEDRSPVLGPDDLCNATERAAMDCMATAGTVIADPIYRWGLSPTSNARFVNLPHEGYSGRLYRDAIPIIMGEGFNRWYEKEWSK